VEQEQAAADSAPKFSEWLADHPLPSEVVEFEQGEDTHRKLHRLRVQTLSMHQLDMARARAFERVTDGAHKPADLGHPIAAAVLQDAVACEVLVLACTTVGAVEMPAKGGGMLSTYPAIFRHVHHLRDSLSATDLRWLWDQYLRIEASGAPVLVGDEEDEEIEDESTD